MKSPTGIAQEAYEQDKETKMDNYKKHWGDICKELLVPNSIDTRYAVMKGIEKGKEEERAAIMAYLLHGGEYIVAEANWVIMEGLHRKAGFDAKCPRTTPP